MYSPTARLLTLLELLQARGWLPGTEIAARLGVDGRTVRRYITMLQDLGIPIESERGRHGAYRLRAGFELPPLIFTDDEALALTLGLLAARRLGLAATAPAVAGASAKVERVLPAAIRERVRAVADTLRFDALPNTTIPTGVALATLSTAVQAGRRVLLRYHATEAMTDTERQFDPLRDRSPRGLHLYGRVLPSAGGEPGLPPRPNRGDRATRRALRPPVRLRPAGGGPARDQHRAARMAGGSAATYRPGAGRATFPPGFRHADRDRRRGPPERTNLEPRLVRPRPPRRLRPPDGPSPPQNYASPCAASPSGHSWQRGSSGRVARAGQWVSGPVA